MVCRRIHYTPRKYAETVVLADLLILWLIFSGLSYYVEGDKQPALELFKALRLFDPHQLPLVPKILNSYKISNTEHSSGKWQIYIDPAANSELPQDPTEYWRVIQ